MSCLYHSSFSLFVVTKKIVIIPLHCVTLFHETLFSPCNGFIQSSTPFSLCLLHLLNLACPQQWNNQRRVVLWLWRRWLFETEPEARFQAHGLRWREAAEATSATPAFICGGVLIWIVGTIVLEIIWRGRGACNPETVTSVSFRGGPRRRGVIALWRYRNWPVATDEGHITILITN